MFCAKAKRIGFLWKQIAASIENLVFIGFALAMSGQEDLPNSCLPAAAHLVHPAVPAVKITHHRDPAGVGRPDGKIRASHAFMGDDMGAQNFPKTMMVPLADQVFIQRTQDWAKTIGII